MVTHDMQLPAIARRVVVMSDGKVKDVIENSEEARFRALQQLNDGIEDLTVFESQSSSVDSRTHRATTDHTAAERVRQGPRAGVYGRPVRVPAAATGAAP